MAQKDIRLKSFTFSNPTLNVYEVSIIKLLKRVLDNSSTAENRRVKRNHENSEEEVMNFFEWRGDELFAMVMTIGPANETGSIPDDYFQKDKFSLEDVQNGEADGVILKDYFYVYVKGKYLATARYKYSSPKRIQTYLNEIVSAERKDTLFELNPTVRADSGLTLQDVELIEFGDPQGRTQSVVAELENSPWGAIRQSILNRFYSYIPDIKDAYEDNLVSLRLSCRVRLEQVEKKPLSSVLAKQLSLYENLSDVTIVTRQGKRKSGEDLHFQKVVPVETTEKGRLDEKQLQQEMQKFLLEVEQQWGDSNV